MDVRTKFSARQTYRGSQVIFGERAHLQDVLRSLQHARLPQSRKQAELKQLTKLINARTAELNRIHPAWDRAFKKARNPRTNAQELLRLATTLSPDDYLLARMFSEHPEAPPELLEHLASHPYAAVRENVARHPHTPPALLEALADKPDEPLWFLVACNPSTPPGLRDRLRARMQQAAAPA